jgi:anti-sigma regulatory factor (Ser/Thr protein kinase)
VDGFYSQLGEDDPPGLLFAAVTAPHALAECVGKRLVVMLDDFQLARQVYEAVPGDSEGAGSIFEETMKYPRAPHVISGSPENAMQEIFSDDALRGSANRITLGPLPEGAAFGLFEAQAKLFGTGKVSAECRPLMKYLGGSPLYIKNLARAVGGTLASEVTTQTLMEGYCRDVVYGETGSYWSSVIAGCIKDSTMTPLAVELLALTAESPRDALYPDRLARRLSAPEDAVRGVLKALGASGMLTLPGLSRPDAVVEDFVHGTRMRIFGETRDAVLESVRRNRFGRTHEAPLSFEMVIPKASETELVAVKAVEQICAGAQLGQDEAKRLSMAIIEACINAMEHGGGYDDRVFLRCSVYPGRIEVAVESRGGPVDPDALLGKSGGMPGLDEARGRGFPLMKRLVDEVRVERIDDRTRVVLVKLIKGAEKT